MPIVTNTKRTAVVSNHLDLSAQGERTYCLKQRESVRMDLIDALHAGAVNARLDRRSISNTSLLVIFGELIYLLVLWPRDPWVRENSYRNCVTLRYVIRNSKNHGSGCELVKSPNETR